MKKISTSYFKFLALLLFCVGSPFSKAQFSFTTNVGGLCISQPTNYVIAQLTQTNVGASSYSWSILPSGCGLFLNAAPGTATFNISCAGNYTLICDALNSSNQVIATTSTILAANNTPTVLISASKTVVCQGDSVMMLASGANTYTWIPGSVAGAMMVVTPTASAIYSVMGTSNITGCSSFAQLVILVNPTPTVNVLGSPSASNNVTVCVGQSATLTATGAQSYVWSNGVNTAMQVVSPLSTTCYSVVGSYATGCTNMKVYCVNVNALPQVNIAGSNTVCQGSSLTFTASGASSYVWHTSATTNTINIIPTGQTQVSVTGTDANGCVNTYSMGVSVNTNCSDVWPGDANSDGNVTSADVFEIGLAFNSTGTARSPGGNTYVAHHATNWSGTVSTNKNLCHADCNGDGTINHSDTVAIFNNFNLQHSFKPTGSSASSDISLIAPPVAYVGIWNVADVVLGSSSSNIGQLYGVSFELDFDVNLVDDAYLVYTTSFLSASNQNVEFRKNFISNGKVVGVSVRTDKNNVSGNGKIAELHYKVKSGLAENTQLDFAVSNSQKIGKDGVAAILVPGTLTQQATNNMVGLTKQVTSANIQVFPNPSSKNLFIKVTSNELANYLVSDLSGRMVRSGSFTTEATIDVSELNSGVYFVEVKTATGAFTQKVIVDHK